MAEKPVKTAAKKAATNVPAIVAVICFTAVMCVFASNLKDGSEAMTALMATVSTFFALFLGYVFTGRRDS